MRNTNFINSELIREWPKHLAYLKTIKKLRNLSEMIVKDFALRTGGKKLYYFTVNETPYFYLRAESRNIDYKQIINELKKLK